MTRFFNCALFGFLRTIHGCHLLGECLQSLVFLWGCWYHCLCLLLLLGTEFSWQQTDHLEELPDVPGQWMLRQKDVHQMLLLMIASLAQTGPQGHSGERKFHFINTPQVITEIRKKKKKKCKSRFQHDNTNTVYITIHCIYLHNQATTKWWKTKKTIHSREKKIIPICNLLHIQICTQQSLLHIYNSI